jgi:hypothetical protein
VVAAAVEKSVHVSTGFTVEKGLQTVWSGALFCFWRYQLPVEKLKLRVNATPLFVPLMTTE